jgi:hypothetical protein
MYRLEVWLRLRCQGHPLDVLVCASMCCRQQRGRMEFDRSACRTRSNIRCHSTSWRARGRIFTVASYRMGPGKGRKKRGVAHIPTRRHSELRIYTGHRTLDHGKPGSHSPDRRRADHWHGVHRRRSYPRCQSKRAWNCDSSEPLGDRRDRHLRGSRRLRRSNRALSHDFPHPSPQCQSQTRRPREQTGLNCLHPERQQLSLPVFTSCDRIGILWFFRRSAPA